MVYFNRSFATCYVMASVRLKIEIFVPWFMVIDRLTFLLCVFVGIEILCRACKDL